MTSSMSLPSLRQIPPTLPHVPSIPSSPAPLPARPVPRKPAPVVMTTPNISPTTSNPRSDGSFAVPQDPVMRKPSIPLSRPSTSTDEKEKMVNRPKSPEFEMGKLPVKNYVPSHFMKGTMIQMASGKLKKVEEMSSDDFLLAAPLTREFNVDASVVMEIARASTLARVKFAVGQTQYEIPAFLSLASLIHELVFNCGDVREVQIHYSLPAENSAGPSAQRTRQPIWSVASPEDVLLREESIPDFLVPSVVCPSH
ncbi:unnamed protein product [Strongylus vulgaris]|uniref:AXH domain-containing protein n=1 Tax=Strongylus vulgaris TaxID=40348 RepID=A0A3P7KBR3_STRVU|nr:unnamed protein product [Strongylus vulgaris]